ncbi:MAG: glutamate synthase large subunit [Candidatus Promineifilaceae bacterium]
MTAAKGKTTTPYKRITPPKKQGLYDPQYEKDACGLGLIAHIDGEKSHQLVQDALTILINMDHRGAKGADPDTGDGAGILVQLPDRFLRSIMLQEQEVVLPPEGSYGVGILFMSPDPDKQQAIRDRIFTIVQEEGQHLLGWRDVPVDNETLGETAKASQPVVKMVFIARRVHNRVNFERKLYRIRRRATIAVRTVDQLYSDEFYVASLSSRTMVLKGMLTPHQVGAFYKDLAHPQFESAIALVHSRFSTNTFPNWARAHPYRYLMHNGEINTLRGNVNWMKARQAQIKSPVFENTEVLYPIVNPEGSDTANFDNVLEFLTLNGLSLSHAMMMMVPEPWQRHETMSAEKRAFYEYHACLMEPWDGPASLALTDGSQVVATLDRNGLRPSRYYITKDNRLILASEAGVLDIAPENIERKGRLEPGRMLVVDTVEGRIISDEELKQTLATAHNYQQWLDEHLLTLDDLPEQAVPAPLASVTQQQLAFGYTFEDLRILMTPMAQKGVEAIGSMGDDTPLAVLSKKSRLLYDYFKQLFAQVTNPPIDAIREELVTATVTYLGTDGNMLLPEPTNARRIKLKHPILSNAELAKIKSLRGEHFSTATLPILYSPRQGGRGIDRAMAYVYDIADRAIEAGANVLVLSDRGVDKRNAPIPALLAVSGLHHYLIDKGTRTNVSIVLESAEPREVHHFCALVGYGAEAINPYLAYASIQDILDKQLVRNVSYDDAVQKYIKAVVKGIVKVCSKMGISTIQSYGGAQIFEALGLNQDFVEQYFEGTATRIQGSDLEIIATETLSRHKAAFPERPSNGHVLPAGGNYQVRQGEERHVYDPITVHALQNAVRRGNYKAFKKYTAGVNSQEKRMGSLRGLLEFRTEALNRPISIDDVEPIESIMTRFKTGAMSYGSISMEAHVSLAIAMNRIGGKSNTGEGGEARWRFDSVDGNGDESNLFSEHLIELLQNGDSAQSAIKQVASGRFGVTGEYLANAKELQIKMAQGAKPGEGGQLPGPKVYPWIAKVRLSTPGVGLISPPPHHDIYSIEDLAQLIFDLKNANPEASVNVKLVSEVGVGTIAAGVAKGHADVILISGYGGGTGAAPQTSIKHTGLPWELGLAETHQTLVLNDLRSRVRLETDGQLKTGRDVIIAAMLGAEEYGFSTAPLVSLGCIMMRVCHLNTCPVGVATQNPELRKQFSGKPEHVVNFMTFIAQEMREVMASLGVRSVDELVGRTDWLETSAAIGAWKAQGIDLSSILFQPYLPEQVDNTQMMEQNHALEETFDYTTLIPLCQPAIDNGEQIRARLPIRNIYRSVGTMLGGKISKRHGLEGLPEDTIKLQLDGTGGNSFAAFLPKGVTFNVSGDANDYFGKGLSGGKLTIAPQGNTTFVPEENIVIGNVALYGATSGEAYIRGMAGERFAVRNSGATAVVEGVGDHGCEYMTGGRVLVLGGTGRNFAAGMSGGVAYVLDRKGDFRSKVNQAMVDVEGLTSAEINPIKELIRNHVAYTDSSVGTDILTNWDSYESQFVRVIPRDYRRVLEAIEAAKATGVSDDEAEMLAFEANKTSKARVAGS